MHFHTAARSQVFQQERERPTWDSSIVRWCAPINRRPREVTRLLCDPTLESRLHVFGPKLLFRPEFRDAAIQAMYLHSLRVRVAHPDESYPCLEPLRDFLFHFMGGVMG